MQRLSLFALLATLTWSAYAQPAAPLLPHLKELDARIMEVFTGKRVAAYSYAASQYLELLRALSPERPAEENAVVLQHLRYVAMIMPEDSFARPALDSLLAGARGSVETLIRWWRRQDPLPASENNERLQEHLARVAFAREHYAHEDDARGMDDRGEIYVRLGAPSRSREIKLLSAGVWLNPNSARLPENDFWVYRQIDKEAHYLFVRTTRSRPYKIATAEDLLPRELVASRRRVGLLIPVMEETFAQLALAHPYYGTTYDALNSYMNIPGYSSGGAYQFVRRLRNKMRLDDTFYARNREHIVPVAFSNTTGDAAPLSPPVRWARFLEDEGQTRIEFYWGLRGADLVPDRRRVRRLEREGHTRTPRYLITFSIAQYGPDYVTEAIDARHFSVSATPQDDLRPQSWSTVTTQHMTHLAAQWEQRWANFEEDGTVTAGAALKIGTHRVDSLAPLKIAPAHLEMSDIRPLALPPGADFADARIYPFDTLSSKTQLALYFEIYHLAFGEDDQAHYTVEYRVESADDPRRAPLAVGSSYRGLSRTARERIRLDLSSWDAPGALNITVRITDEVSAQSAARTIRFNFTG